MRGVMVLLAAVLLTAAGCGTPQGVDQADDQGATTAPPAGSIPDCTEVSQVQLDGAAAPPPSAREKGAELAGPAANWARQDHPDRFAGAWIDRERGGALVLAFTGDPSDLEPEVRQRFGAEVALVGVDHALRDLEQVQREIGEELWAGAGPEGPTSGQVTHTGVDVQRNRVAVGVFGDPDGVRAQLAERFDPAVICLDVEDVPDVEDVVPAQWEPARGADLSAAVTSIAVLVNERSCAGGTSAEGRIAPPDVVYGAEAVVITIRVIPRGGANTCPSNPDTPFVVELDEPLGDRTLLDGALDPPAPPRIDR